MKTLSKILLMPVFTALLCTSSIALSADSFTARPTPQKYTGNVVVTEYYLGRTRVGYFITDCYGNFLKESWGYETKVSREKKYPCSLAPKPKKPSNFKAK